MKMKMEKIAFVSGLLLLAAAACPAATGPCRQTLIAHRGHVAVSKTVAQPPENTLAALDEAFRGRIPEILLGVLRMMVARGHVAALNRMAEDYNELSRQYRGESVAIVTSAVPLKEAEMVRLRDKLVKKLGRRVTLSCHVDPSLIGGVRVEVDGRVIDGSIRNKLDEIKEVMNA